MDDDYTVFLGSNNQIIMSLDEKNARVGVGMSNPAYPLHVTGDIGADRIYLGYATYTAAPRVNLQNVYSTCSIGVADQPARFHQLASNGDLVIRQNAGRQIIFGTAFTSPTFVMKNNLVGINQGNPLYQLDVGGSINYNGALLSNGVNPFTSINALLQQHQADIDYLKTRI